MSPQVWMFLGVALVIVSLITALFNSMHAAKLGRRYSYLGFVSDAIWQYLENLFFEASAQAPTLGGERLLSAAWWLAALVLMNAFCGHMRACLMIKSEVEKIESARQLVRKPHTLPHMWLGTSYVAMVAYAAPPARSIRRLVEAGLVNYWWTRATGDVSRCGGSSSSSGPEQASTLGFADVFGVFVLWLACAGISALVFFAELCTPRTDEMSKKLAAAAASRCRHRWRAGRLPRSRSRV
ncbi:hypothetical protein V5799_032103 [Amblyomma americanum]|uniref:Ionotropic glutamate receptor C-terminal domain-containing protein n=1 Tax=Amblyomma americanum TaxID=6943 RepID=A0AAQ4DS27_AMBAM